MSAGQPSGETALESAATYDVFITYAREDREFVQRLDEALQERGRTTWIDWKRIPPSAEWMAEIENAIVRSHAYVFVVTPSSAASEICGTEAEIAARHNKKVIPLNVKAVEPLPPAIAKHQWIDAEPPKDFFSAVNELVAAFDRDLGWIRTHTDLLERAVRWTADTHRTSLLEGRELEDAEAWLAAGSGRETQPTDEQVAFISSSRWKAALAQANEHYERSFELSRTGRRQAAAAHLLRAVELAPAGGAPDAYPASSDDPAWAEDAWTAYRYLDAERGRLRGRLHAPGPVSCVALDAEATVAVVGSVTGAVELWDLEKSERLRSLSGVLGAVSAVAVSPAGEVLAAGSDGTVLAWAPDRDAPRSVVRFTDNLVTAVAFAADGRLALGLRDGHLILYDAAGEELARSRPHYGSVTTIAFDGQTVLTGSGRPATGEWLGEGTVNAWSPADDSERTLLLGTLEGRPLAVAVRPSDGSRLRSLAGGAVELFPQTSLEVRRLQHAEAVRAVAFGAASDTAITGCDDGIVRIWDVTEAGEQAAFDGHLDAVTCLLPSADGTILLSGSLDGSVAVWDLERPSSQVAVGRGGSAVAVSADDRIAVGDRDGAIELIEGETRRDLMTLRRPGPISSLCISPDSGTVLTGYEDGGITVWDVASGRRAASLPSHAPPVKDIVYNADATLAGSAYDDGTLRLWEISTWETRAVLTGHEGTVFAAVFTDEGELVSCGADGTVRLWSAEDGSEIRLADCAKMSLLSVAATSDGTTFAAAGADGVVRIFATDARPTGTSRRRPATIRAHDQAATSVAITADGRLLLSASLDGTVKCWELATCRQVLTFSHHTGGVFAVTIGPEGRAYSAGEDGFVWVWDHDTGEPIGRFHASSSGLSSLALSADGETLAAGSLNGSAYVWNTTTGELLRELGDGHRDAIEGLAFNADGSVLASVSRDATARLWTAAGEQLVAKRLFAQGTSVAWHPTSPRLVIGSGNKQHLTDQTFGAVGGRIALGDGGEGGAIVWGADSGPPRFLERHSQLIQEIAVTPDGRIVTASDDASVRVWDAESGRQVRLLEGHRDPVWALAVSPDGSMAATGSIDRDVRLWDLESGESTRVIEQEAGVGCLALSAGGTRLVTGSADRTVRIFDVASGEELRLLRVEEGGIAALAVDANACQVLCGTLEGHLLLWDVGGGGPPRALPPHDDSIWGIVIGRDGSTAVTTSEDGTARVWDLETLEVRHTLTAHGVPLRRAAISPDGSEIAIGAADYAVRTWDLQSGNLNGILTGHWSEAICVAYNAEGTTIYAGGADGSVRRWSRAEQDGVAATAQWHDALVADYHPSGEALAVGGGDGSLRLWDSDHGELIALLQGHTAPVTSVHVHPGGWHVVSGSMDGSVRVWDLRTLQERHVFTDNEGPVSAVLFLEGGKVVVSASLDGELRVRSTRTGRLLRLLAGPARPRLALEIPFSSPGSDVTMQFSFGGNPFVVLAARPTQDSVVVGYGDDSVEMQLVRPDAPKAPPLVDASLDDPYGAFHALYTSVGLRVARDGPNAGDLIIV